MFFLSSAWQLASIPGFEEKPPAENPPELPSDKGKEKADEENSSKEQEAEQQSVDETDKEAEAKNEEELIPVCKHELYQEFFKMKNIGAAVAALKRTMTLRGLDPDMLE